MKVQVCSPTAFWVVDLARQMERLGVLARFCTGLPSSRTPGLPASKVARQPALLAPTFLSGKIRLPVVNTALTRMAHVVFQRWLTTKVAECDVFHCLSGFGLQAHRLAKARFGALTVCDRGSCHIAYQDDLLREEYARWGARYAGIDRWIIDQELAEYEECDLISVPSTFVWNSFVERGVPTAKLALAPYGVDLSQFRQIPKDDGVFRIVYAGQLSLRKGIPYLLEAVSHLPFRDIETVLIGPVAPEIEPILERFGGRFTIVGPKPRGELYRYYSQGSVFVIASVEEGLALVQAQAMACGLPVIATRSTGAENLFDDGVEGYIVPPRDPEAIRERLIYLYENPDVRARMSEAAARRVNSIGGWNGYGDGILARYAQLCAQQRSAASP
jgi:glycosyltransferase involved in cell wall biosynthesis